MEHDGGLFVARCLSLLKRIEGDIFKVVVVVADLVDSGPTRPARPESGADI